MSLLADTPCSSALKRPGAVGLMHLGSDRYENSYNSCQQHSTPTHKLCKHKYLTYLVTSTMQHNFPGRESTAHTNTPTQMPPSSGFHEEYIDYKMISYNDRCFHTPVCRKSSGRKGNKYEDSNAGKLVPYRHVIIKGYVQPKPFTFVLHREGKG